MIEGRRAARGRAGPEALRLYGADLCLQAQTRGLQVVVLDAPVLHNSRHVRLPAAFAASARRLAEKWPRRLPVPTSCACIGHGGALLGL